VNPTQETKTIPHRKRIKMLVPTVKKVQEVEIEKSLETGPEVETQIPKANQETDREVVPEADREVDREADLKNRI
jgi:hypothetical protein